jgi:hypothetical protein
MSQRESDLKLLSELLDEHSDELTDWEAGAFADMRFDLQAYGGIVDGAATSRQYHQLTDKQRQVVVRVHERLGLDYVNLASSGTLAKGTPTTESRALDRMLAGPKVTKPPRRRGDDE